MLWLINEIIKNFGGRAPGSREESEAQYFMREYLAGFCHDTSLHEFSNPVDAKFSSLKYFSFTWILSLFLLLIFPWVSAFILFILLILFLGHFVIYGNWLDFLFPLKRSVNVTGIINPESEIKQTVILSGHIDSVREFIWFKRWKFMGMFSFLLAGLLIPLLLIFNLIILITGGILTPFNAWFIVWSVFLLLSVSQITYILPFGKIVVDGAIDNLSGVALASETGRFFSGGKGGVERLKHTRIIVASFACEEAGLKGSLEFVKKYGEELKKGNSFLINFDSIKNDKFLTLQPAEIMTLTKFNSQLFEKLKTSFENCGVEYFVKSTPVGATDATSFQRAGIPSASIIGIPTDSLDPSYHTRYDTVENLDPAGIEKLKLVMIDFLKNSDKQIT